MQRWTYGGNNLPQFNSGHITLITEPWWLYWASELIDLLGYGCQLFHWIPLPSFISFYSDFYKEKVSLKDYYGDVGQLYHVFIYDPLFLWSYTLSNKNSIDINMTYTELKALLYKHDPKYFDYHESILDEVD